MRASSLDAYRDALLKMPRRQRQVLAALAVPRRTHQTRLWLAQSTGIPINSVCSTVNALIKAEYLRELPRAECPVSGKSVYGLELTDMGWAVCGVDPDSLYYDNQETLL